MGMDVYVSGELMIPPEKIPEAMVLFLKVLADGDLNDPRFGGTKWNRHPWTPDDDEPCDTTEQFVELLDLKFERFGVELFDTGYLVFDMDDSCRHEEYDLWVFKALAPVIDDGEFLMEGDGYHWKWAVKSGVLTEHSGDTVYDHDYMMAPTIEKIVSIIYPASLEGKPLQVEGSGAIGTLHQIENLLREAGFGPQAGMSELDRLAGV